MKTTKMNLLRLLLLISLLWTSAYSLAQDTTTVSTYSDLLYLRDGSVLQGRLLHYILGEKIVFELSTGDHVEFEQRKVKRLVQGGEENIPPVKPRKEYEFREEGLYFAALAGITIGRTSRSTETGSWNLLAVAGHLFKRQIGVGGGIAVDGYSPQESEIIYPVFAEARGYLSASRYAPFYAMRLGYGFAFKESDNLVTGAEGGVFVNPALGLRWGGSAGANFVTELGFQYQRASFERSIGNWGEMEIEKKGYKRLNIRVGIVF